MRRFLQFAILFLACAAPAFAQFTTVTATITDPNGIPYAGATMSAILVPGSSGGFTLSGKPYSGQIGPVALDPTGKFSQNFGDVTLITPSGAQWLITIDSAGASIALPLGTGPQSFTYTSTGTTISGGSLVNLTTALNALAPKLTNFAGAGTGTISGTMTAGYLPKASAATVLTNSLCDEGITTANTLTCGDTAGAAFLGALNAAASIAAGTLPASCGAATGIFCAVEASTAGTPTSGQDYIRADSGSHSFLCSFNAAAEVPCGTYVATSAGLATATTAGTCVSNTTTVTGATTAMVASASPVSTPGVGAQWSAFVSSANTVTVIECAVATSAGGTIAFNIRVRP